MEDSKLAKIYFVQFYKYKTFDWSFGGCQPIDFLDKNWVRRKQKVGNNSKILPFSLHQKHVARRIVDFGSFEMT